jgi:hypothetical protein
LNDGAPPIVSKIAVTRQAELIQAEARAFRQLGGIA